VSKIWTISCCNSATVRNRICQLLLLLVITNRKSHTSFRLIPTSMTLNDLERRSPYFAFFFTEFDCLASQLRHSGWRQTYTVRKILSPCYSLPLLALQRGLCDSWATCYNHEHRARVTALQLQVAACSTQLPSSEHFRSSQQVHRLPVICHSRIIPVLHVALLAYT